MLGDRFQKYITDNSLVDRHERILLAVSGGIDSMVMLSLFIEAGYNIGIAHCNYQLRGEDSDNDELLVISEAKKHNIPIFTRRFDVPSQVESTGESLQMVTRKQRYTWFSELCAREGYDVISVAHHADDSIETFFINLIRGTGLRGLTGISMVNGRVIRPLLFASRNEISEYALNNNVSFREDSSNSTTKYLRNKIRHGIIPAMKEIRADFTSHMSENIDRLTDAQIFIDKSIEIIYNEAVSHDGSLTVVDPRKISDTIPLNFVLYEILSSKFGFNGDVVDTLFEALQKNATGKTFHSRSHLAYIDRGNVIITKIEDRSDLQLDIYDTQQKLSYDRYSISVKQVDIGEISSLIQPNDTALLDYSKLSFPLHIRAWQEGDHFMPLGMSNRKKVSDFLIDAKVPIADKKRQLVVTNGNGDIVWLVGRRIDNRYKVEKDSKSVFKITVEMVD